MALYSDLRSAKSKATRPSKKSTIKKPKLSKASSLNTDGEDDLGNRPTTPEPAQRKPKKPSAKPLPIQTDDESDDFAIKKTKAPKRVEKGKARETESPPETFESAGTDVDLEASRPGPSNMKPLSAEEKSLRDAPPDAYQTIASPIISRVAPDRRDSSEEKEEKPPPKKRGRPRKEEGEGPPPKRGKVQKVDKGGDDKGSTKSKTKGKAKNSSPKPKSTTAKGKARKKVDPPVDTSDEEKEGSVPPGTKASGSNTRKRQRRTLDDGSDDEKRGEPDGDESSSYPTRVRLDSIPPEGVIIRKKNGIVEKLLPPTMYVQFCCLR